MKIQNFDYPAKQIFRSNILLIVCCVFYLIWWLLAFNPTGAIRGMKTGWLLIPAFAAGLIAIMLAVKGIQSASIDVAFFQNKALLLGGIAVYLVLLVITRLFFKRPVTTELFLIVGWAVLTLFEINTLYGVGHFPHGVAVFFVVVIGVATLVSLVCYVLYYNLGDQAGYFDGMVPLLMVALTMAGISVSMAVYRLV